MFIDWDKTKIVGSAQGPLYINSSIMTGNEITNLKEEIITKLESFKDPETGKNPIKKVYRSVSTFSKICRGESSLMRVLVAYSY